MLMWGRRTGTMRGNTSHEKTSTRPLKHLHQDSEQAPINVFHPFLWCKEIVCGSRDTWVFFFFFFLSFLSVFVLVLESEHVKRFGVSSMQDILKDGVNVVPMTSWWILWLFRRMRTKYLYFNFLIFLTNLIKKFY